MCEILGDSLLTLIKLFHNGGCFFMLKQPSRQQFVHTCKVFTVILFSHVHVDFLSPFKVLCGQSSHFDGKCVFNAMISKSVKRTL